jgi:transposase
MIRPSEIWVIVDPVDMRSGIDGLSLRVQNLLGRTPCDGTAYAFRNRRGTRLKLLIWDGTGVWLCQRRLHRGHFTWPTADTTTVTLAARQWNWLVTGVEWQRLAAPAPVQWRV